MRIGHLEVPVFIDAHGGSVCVPAGVSKQQVFKARQHLRHKRRESEFGMKDMYILRILSKGPHVLQNMQVQQKAK